MRAAGAACRRVLCVRVLVVTGRYRAGARIGISTDPRVVLGGSSPALETCHPWRLPSVGEVFVFMGHHPRHALPGYGFVGATWACHRVCAPL